MQRLIDLEVIITEAKAEKEFLIKHEVAINTCPFHIVFSGKDTRIIINNIGQLVDARSFMFNLFGTRKFEQAQTFYSSGTAISTFTAKDICWSIWLECLVKDFPKELLRSDDCEWVETTEKNYHLACNL